MGKPFTILVGQSGGPTAAVNASLAGVVATAQREGMRTLGMRYGIEGFMAGGVVDLDRLLSSAFDLQLLRGTPASWLGSCRYRLPPVDQDETTYASLFAKLNQAHVDAVLYIGGNDSMDTIAKLDTYAKATGSTIRFIGIPKTIDNDLVLTDHTPGYGSAAKFIATSVRELARDSDVYNLKSVTIVEIMGRNAGWLAASACLANEKGAPGADLILLPERPLNEARLLERIQELLAQKNTVVIAASEGLKDAKGKLVALGHLSKDTMLDAFGHEVSLSGTGRHLASLIGRELGCKARAVELSTLQRCASHTASATDLSEAYALGGASVLAASAGMSGMMSVLERLMDLPYLCKTELVDVHAVANREKLVPHAWISADDMGVTEELRRYVAPLISYEVSPVYVSGVPHLIAAL